MGIGFGYANWGGKVALYIMNDPLEPSSSGADRGKGERREGRGIATHARRKIQRSEKWLVHGWVKFVPALA